MKFTSRMWFFIWNIYKFKQLSQTQLSLLRFERNSTIPYCITLLKYIKLHCGKDFFRVRLTKSKFGQKLGFYLLTRYPTKKKKKKKKK